MTPNDLAAIKPEPYRVGSHYGIHVYQGDRPVATFHDADEAARLVATVNDAEHLANEVERLTRDRDAAEANVRAVEDLIDEWRQRAANARDFTDDDWAGDGWTDVADELRAALADPEARS